MREGKLRAGELRYELTACTEVRVNQICAACTCEWAKIAWHSETAPGKVKPAGAGGHDATENCLILSNNLKKACPFQEGWSISVSFQNQMKTECHSQK